MAIKQNNTEIFTSPRKMKRNDNETTWQYHKTTMEQNDNKTKRQWNNNISSNNEQNDDQVMASPMTIKQKDNEIISLPLQWNKMAMK